LGNAERRWSARRVRSAFLRTSENLPVRVELFRVSAGKPRFSCENIGRVYLTPRTCDIGCGNGHHRVGDWNRSYTTISKAVTLLGYRPQATLEEALENFAAWFCADDPNQSARNW
jgi:nucleoside-diphosphate-sugar epimerase